LLQFARVLVAAGRLEEAGRALSAIPDNLTPASRIEWLRTRADLLLAQKRWAEARKEIETLLALEPLDGRSMLSLGRTYREEGNAPRAMLAYEAAGRSPETAYEASVELANIEIQNRHFAKSVDYLERALSIQKTDVIEDALARVKSLVSRETNPN
jgi:tetratricopeptide (TPR) repeat protein